MGQRRRTLTEVTLFPASKKQPRFASLDAARRAGKPAIHRLYANWVARRKAAVAAYMAEHHHPPTAAQIAVDLRPRLSLRSAAWYLKRVQREILASSTSIPHFASLDNQGRAPSSLAAPAAIRQPARQRPQEGDESCTVKRSA